MFEEPDPDHWPTLDRWWDNFVETPTSLLTTSTTVALDSRSIADVPAVMDPWWIGYVDINPVLADDSAALVDPAGEDGWLEVAPWWEAYVDARAEDVAGLDRALAESTALWERQDGPFDADPLAADLGQEMRAGDPLNPGVETEWSDWLAQLLRTDSGEFHRELFGDGFASRPRRVEREAHLPERGGIDRYADILSVHESGGLSIEVKIGDKNFGKTTHTARLIETQRYGEWDHYMLLPEPDLWALRESFDEKFEEDDGEMAVLPSEESEDVALLFWSDVSRAIRTVLLEQNTQDPHWSASAYLFCTQIELERLGFTAQPVVERLRTGGDRIRALQSVSVAIDDLESQFAYLQAFTEATNE